MPLSLIPQDDRQLQHRIQRQLMGFVSYLMFLIPLSYAVHEHWLKFGYRGLALFLGLALAINVIFFVAIRTGATRRFADPSLMMLQIAVAGILALVIGYYVDASAMVIVLMLFFTSFFFGIFSFSAREYLALTVAAAFGYALMLACKYDPSQRDSAAFRLELLHFTILIIVLLWMSFLGSYIASLRASLGRRKSELAIALGRLKELASRDELTGLHNRRHLMETLEQQQERAQRHAEPFALCILDLDHFKRVNDTWGHGVGDEVLQGFSERIRSNLRRMDVICRSEIDSTFGRYGGEEFLLLLPYAQCSTALMCVHRLHAAVRACTFDSSAGPLRLTFSAGVAAHRPGDSVAEVITRADEALYRAKSAGRDRVECSE